MRSCRDFDELVRTIAEQASEKYRVLGEETEDADPALFPPKVAVERP